MNQAAAFLKRHSLVIGIILMFALTWPIDLANSGVLPFQVSPALAIFVGSGGILLPLAITATDGNLLASIAQLLIEGLVALIITIRMGPARLSRTESVQVQGSASTQPNQISQLVS